MNADWLVGLSIGTIVGFILASIVFTVTVYRRLHRLNDIKEYLRSIGALVEQIRIELTYHVEGHGPSPVHHEVRHNVSESTVREAEQAVDNALDNIERTLSESFRRVGLNTEWNRQFSRFHHLGGLGGSWLSTPSWQSRSLSIYRGPAETAQTETEAEPTAEPEPEEEEVNNDPINDIDLEL